MSSFVNTSFSAAAKEGANNSAKSNASLTGNNVGSGGGARGAEAGGMSVGEWPVRVNGNSTVSTTTPTPLVSRSSTGPRRPSLSTTLSHHPNHHSHNFVSSPLTPSASSTSLNSSTNSSLYHPPHHYNSQSGGGGGSNGGVNGPRSYSREEMLNIFKSMPSSAFEKGLQDLLKRVADTENGGGGKEILAEVCWVDSGVTLGPVSLEDMTAEERELYSGNINSPQKQPPPMQNNQNNNPNSTSSGASRKNTGTIGINSTGNLGSSSGSPASLRNQNVRRNTRDTSDNPGPHISQSPGSPAAARDHSQQPHSSLSRRRTDLRGSIADTFGDLDKDPTGNEKKEGGSNSRPNFGRWGSITTSNTSGDRHGDDHHDVPTPTSATVNRSMGLFRRGSSAWGNSSIGSAGGLALGVGLGSGGSGAAAFNNGTFGGSAGFALSGGVPSSSASNSADKRLGSKSGSTKGESGGIGEKSSASSIKSNSGEQDPDKDGESDKRPLSKSEEAAEDDRFQRLHESTFQNVLKEEDEENDSFEPDMGQQSQRFQYYQDSTVAFDPQRNKENSIQHEERPMSSDTDPYGRRDSLMGYLHEDSIGTQHPQAHSSIAAAIGTEQARLKAASPFSGAGSSVTTPTRSRGDIGFSTRDFVTGGGLGSLHTQLRDLNINQQGGMQGSRLLGGATSQEGSGENEPLSPTETNPYQSPAPEKEDDSNLGNSGFHDDDSSGFVGIGMGGGSLRRPGVGEGGPGSDRSGRSSAAGLGSALGGPIGGLANLGMGDIGTPAGGLWGPGSGVLPLGTPSRLGGVNAGPGSFFGTLGTEGPLGGPALLGTSGQGTGLGSVSRASKLGALFMDPEFQQQQQHQQLQHHSNEGGLEGNDTFDSFRLAGGGSVGVNTGRRLFGIGGGLGGAESPLRGNDVNDLFMPGSRGILGGGVGDNSIFSQMGGDNHHGGLQGLHGFPQPTPPIRPPPQQQISSIGQPTGQQTALVMPDKIQWEYRDPQGIIQGPFSGLEMHDWFKGGYFPQDLNVKRVEDPEFEPLSQLIRRIGNQREPFLVPLQGITQGGPSWGPASGWTDNSNQPPGTVQPPFANSFPTFGTTLTAEQQNALERRKQEEQFLMARQREFLVQQQLAVKQAQVLQQQQLHHIHPQPSLGGLPAPIGAGAVGLGGIGGFSAVGAVGPIGAGVGSIGSSVAMSALQPGHHSFEPGALLRQAGAMDAFPPSRLDEVLQHGMNQGNMIPAAIQQPPIQTGVFGPQQPPNPIQTQQQHMQQAQQAFQLQQQAIIDRQRQQVVEKQQQEKEELEAHEQQQAPVEIPPPTKPEQNIDEKKVEDLVHPAQEQPTQPTVQPPASVWGNQSQPPAVKAKSPPPAPTHIDTNIHETQIQAKKIATPKATSPAAQSRKLPNAVSPWQQTQNEPSPIAPFPPPPGAANKAGEPLSINISGAARTSPVETPHTGTSVSIAPWAQKVEESSKGPSLKEIQEMEAKQAAALAEAMAEQARKEAALQQSTAATQPMPLPQLGLPSTATWGSSSPATTPGNTPSAWGGAKPLMKSTTLPIQTGSPKKTLQQIQKEEEAKKVKSAQQAAAAHAASALAALGAQTATTPGGKRYADLAGKQPVGGSSGGITAGGAWTTVGAGGKIKTPGGASTPVTPATSTTPVIKNIATTGVMGSFGKVAVVKQHPNISNPGTTASPAPSTPSVQASIPKTPAMLAQEEFMKWCRISLKQLNSNVNQEEFLQSLLSFPPETDLIADSIYANSSTMDGNRFAEEFVRRRKSAQQGVVVEAGSTGNSGGGGWNEVAAKAGRSSNASGAVAAEPVGFKVVPGKKKGRK